MYGKFCFTVDIIDVIDEDLFCASHISSHLLNDSFFSRPLDPESPDRTRPDLTRPGPGPGPLEKDMDLIN